MKVLLVRPSPPKFTIGLKDLMVCEPLELEYVAGGLASDQVKITDLIYDRDLAGTMASFRPDVVGTSSYITGVPEVKKICRRAKSMDRRILTVVGGVHATLVPEDYNDASVDLVVRGDGTHAMRRILDRFRAGEGFEDLPNLGFPGESGLRYSPIESLSVDAEALPFPRRDLVEEHWRKYYYLFHQPVALMKTTFGCPFKCSFCFCWPLNDGKVTMRSPLSVVEELETIRAKDVYIVDDTFFVDAGRLKELHDLIVRRGIDKHYLVYGHSDFIVRHPHVIRDWAEIGLKACIVGLESPIEADLKGFNKRATLEGNTEAIEILRRNGVDTYGSFIVDPSWSEREFALLEDYIGKTGLYYIVIQPLTPLPGTEIFPRYKGNLIVDRKQHELWDMQHVLLPTRVSEKEFYRRIRKIYIRTCLNPWKAHSLKLRTAPPIISRRYLRLLLGGFRVFLAMRKAHLHRRMSLSGSGVG